MRLPSIETRTVKIQKGNYLTIDTRILEQLGRTEVSVRGLTEPVWVAPPSKPALGPAEVPGMVEVEVIQTAQATTSQTASLTVNQEPAGGGPNGTRKTQEKGNNTPDRDSGDVQDGDDEGGENDVHPVRSDALSTPERSGSNGKKWGHRKGKLIGKQPSKKGQKGKPKKKTVTPAFPLVKRTDQPRRGGLQYQGPCLMAGQTYPPVDKKLVPLRVVKAREFKTDGRIKIIDWTGKQIKECHKARMEGWQVLHWRYCPRMMALR